MHPERHPNPDRSAESLAARLRALPPPPVPANLEARLLAAIPAARSIPQRRWGVRVGAIGALAAACLLAVLAWQKREGGVGRPAPSASAGSLPAPPSLRPPEDSDSIAAWRQTRRVLDEAEPPTFTWPLPLASPVRLSTSIPPDLLD